MPGVNPDIDGGAAHREARKELFRVLNRVQRNLENADVDIEDYEIIEKTVNDADGNYSRLEVTVAVGGHVNDVE